MREIKPQPLVTFESDKQYKRDTFSDNCRRHYNNFKKAVPYIATGVGLLSSAIGIHSLDNIKLRGLEEVADIFTNAIRESGKNRNKEKNSH